MTVSDVLKAHVLAAVEAAQQSAGNVALPAEAVSTPPADLEARLAEMTRRAQESLAVLVGGLTTATRSLTQSLTADVK